MENKRIRIDYSKSTRLDPFFMAFGYACADFTYTCPTLKMYDYLSSYASRGRKYMRVHGILTCHGHGDGLIRPYGSDDGFPDGFAYKHIENAPDITVTKLENGKLRFDWNVVDRVYDTMIEHGFTPIVEMCWLPSAMRSKECAYIPESFDEWRETAAAFSAHVLERYGIDELKHWYFEIWNEPDGLPLFCKKDSDLTPFFKLYDYMVDGVTSVNPQLKVGGPSVKQFESSYWFMEKWLEHCVNGENCATGAKGTRIDFISVHCKAGGIEFGSPAAKYYMYDSLEKFVKQVKKYEQLADVPIFNDEADPVWCGAADTRDYSWLNFRNSHYFAGFVCKLSTMACALAEDKWRISMPVMDSDNCHIQWEKRLFDGCRSQLTPLFSYPSADLIRKPVFNAYVLLAKLREKRALVNAEDDGGRYNHGLNDKYGVLPSFDEKSAALLSWYFEDSPYEDGCDGISLALEADNMPLNGEFDLVEYRIDGLHSGAYGAWAALGRPETPDADMIKTIRNAEGVYIFRKERVNITSRYTTQLDLPAHCVSLIVLTPVCTKAPEPVKPWKAVREVGANGNQQAFLKWEPSKADDLLGYRILRRQMPNGEFEQIGTSDIAVYVDMELETNTGYEYAVVAVNNSEYASEPTLMGRIG